jgi:GTP diphosphokinase / guanosine-3',5'-bis(diphosphate) 3'-diphosphatase
VIPTADSFAERRHAGQFRKNGTTPYITHPRIVLNILRDEAGITDPDTLAASLLHDTIEDTGVTHDELILQFGKAVADIVREVTDDKTLSKGKRKQEQNKIANMRDIIAEPAPDWDAARKIAYYEHARAVVGAIGRRHSLLERLFETTYLSGIDHLKP